jgi:hypothetical protein
MHVFLLMLLSALRHYNGFLWFGVSRIFVESYTLRLQ